MVSRHTGIAWLLVLAGGLLAAGHGSASTPIWDCAPQPVHSNTSGESGGIPPYEGLVRLEVNGVAQPSTVYVVRDPQKGLFMAECDFLALGLSRGITAQLTNRARLVPLNGQTWIQANLDEAASVLRLTILPDAFPATYVNLSRGSSAPMSAAAASGGYLNYTLQAADSPDSTLRTGLILDALIFGDYGLLQSASSIRLQDADSGNAGSRHQRLATTWTLDHPRNRTTLQIGDGITAGVGASPALRFGGLSFGSNFELDPSFTPYSTLNFSGTARVPSTVEFLLNDRRISPAVELPPGPFTIDRLPTVDGAGDVQVLIRDVLGNEQLVILPYFKSATLLGQGVYQHRHTLGLKRLDYDRYRDAFLATQNRYGFTPSLTAQWTASLDAERVAVGAGLAFRLGRDWVAETLAAQSQGPEGLGHRIEAGLYLQQFRSLNLGLTHRSTSRYFRLVGDPLPGELIGAFGITSPFEQERELNTLSLTKNIGGWGTLNASHTYRSTWGVLASQRLTTLGWSTSLRPGVGLSFTLIRTDDRLTSMLLLHINFDARTNMRVSLARTNARDDSDLQDNAVEYSRALPTSEGLGYRLGRNQVRVSDNRFGGTGSDLSRSFAGAQLRSHWGLHTADIEHRRGGQSWRLQTSGAVGLLKGYAFSSPPISGAFAVVSTKDAGNIPIYRDHNQVATTNRKGVVVVPHLRPYEENRISIQPEDVPFEYQVSKTQYVVAPRTRGGVALEFPITRQAAALIRLQDPQGRDLPVGSRVTLKDTQEVATVGFRGEVYFSNLPAKSELLIEVNRQQCQLQVTRPDGEGPQPRIGPLVCDLQPAAQPKGNSP